MIVMAAVLVTMVCIDPGRCQQGHEFTVPIYLGDKTCHNAPVVPQGYVAQMYPGYLIKKIECKDSER